MKKETLRLRVTTEMKAAVERAAQRSGITATAFTILALNEKMGVVPPAPQPVDTRWDFFIPAACRGRNGSQRIQLATIGNRVSSPPMPNSLLYSALCGAIRSERALRWVFDPISGLYCMSEFMRGVLGLRNRECYVDEVRGWILDFDAQMDQATAQLKVRAFYDVVSQVRVKDGTVETWRGHGRFVVCGQDVPAPCATPCAVPRCRVIYGVSEPVTSHELSPRRARHQQSD